LLSVSSFSSIGSDTTLCVIPCDQPAFSMMSYQNQNNVDKQKIKVKTINAIDILIYDENNNLLDFNNANWTITLCLENVRFKPELISSFREIVNNRPIENEKIEDLEFDQKLTSKDNSGIENQGDKELDLLTE
jgi:hypothetical protein